MTDVSPHLRRNQPADGAPIKYLYPSTRFHPDGSTCIVQDPAEDAALDGAWTSDLASLSARARDLACAMPGPMLPTIVDPTAELAAAKARALELEAELKALKNPTSAKANPIATELAATHAKNADLEHKVAEAKADDKPKK